MKEHLKVKIEELETDSKKEYNRDLYRNINDFRKVSYPGNYIVKMRRSQITRY